MGKKTEFFETENDQICQGLRCFSLQGQNHPHIKVFQYSFSEARPIFSITLKVIFSSSERYKIFTSD